MKPQWEAAVMELSIDPTAEHIATRTHGQVDQLAGLDAVLTGRDLYIVKFAPKTVGVMMPGNRQQVSKWLREVAGRKASPLSSYLAEAASFTDKVGTEIIMAMDLEDVASPDDIRNVLEVSEVIKNNKVKIDDVVATFSGVRGATLGIRVTNRVYGKLKIDFQGDAKALTAVAKPLVIETLANAGAAIEEMEDWQAKVEGKRLTLEGELTRRSLRRLFSFLELESSTVKTPPKTKEPASPASGDSVAYATLDHFKAVRGLLGDLKQEKSVSIGQIGLWIDKYANKIDRLPTLNVDPEMVNYSQNVVQDLRQAVGAIQGIGIQSAAREKQIYQTYRYNAQYESYGPVARYGAYGGYRLYGGTTGYVEYESRNVGAERRAVRYEEKAKGANDARAMFAQIDKDTSAIRIKMTDKYKIQF
jgi:hypothetical protein